MNQVTRTKIQRMYQEGELITMLTAYDYPSAMLVDQAGVDMILVGDSLGMVVLGYDSTIPVTIEDMLHHTKAVRRGTKHAFVVTDLPFLSYHGSFDRTLDACRQLMQEGGTQAVKLEGGQEIEDTVRRLTSAGVPVVGHLGLTPQSVHQLGGYKVQGKEIASAKKLLDDARILEEAGALAIVLECIPAPLAEKVTEQCSIPTIGIGAGSNCSGQVLVYHDLVGYGSHYIPQFVKQYEHVADPIMKAIQRYVADVKSRSFPESGHAFQMNDQVLQKLYGGNK